MRLLWILSLCLCIGVFVYVASADESRSVESSDYATAYAAAKQEGRPLIVMVGAEWCSNCPAAHKHVAELRERGVFVYLDADKDKTLVSRLGVHVRLPMVVAYERPQRAAPVRTVIVGAEHIAAWAVRPAKPARVDVQVGVKGDRP